MNVEARRPSSSDEVESTSIDLTEISSTNSSKQKPHKTSSQNSDTESISSESSSSRSDATDASEEKENAPPDPKDNRPETKSRSRSSVSSFSKEPIEDKSTKSHHFDLVNGDIGHSDSGSSVKENHSYASSSIVSESDKGLLRSILSDSSSDKIITDIDAASPKDGKFSSSTDEELLRKFREQQANRRFRPRSAKFRRDADPEPETVQRVHSRASDKGSSKDSYSSDSSDQEENSSRRRKRQAKKTIKASSSSASKSSASKKGDESSRSPSPSSSIHSGDEEPQREKAPQTAVKKPTKQSLTKTTTGSETSDSLTTSATSPSESTLQERPPSRQGKRPKLSSRKHSPTRSKSEKTRSHRRVLNKKSETLPLDSQANWPNQAGFWWPYNEDAGEREIRRDIEYHKRKYHSLLAQEYLQRHLEIELRRAGAQFKQYERGPRPISPKQVQKFKEKNVTWIYLDGKLYNLKNGMGGRNTTQRGRQRNRVIPKKDKAASRSRSRERNSKSGERPKRSVSFEKGAGRRISSARSTDGNPLINLIKGLSPRRKKKTKRRGSGSSSRKSSLSSRGSARTLSRSSSRTSQSGHGSARGKRSRSSNGASRSGSRSSSKGSKSSSRGLFSRLSPKRDKSPRDKQTERPKSALRRPKSAKFGRLRSTSSNSKSSVDRSSSKERGEKKKKSKSSRRSSSTSSEKNGKKSKESSKHKDTHYRIDEDPKLNRVLFTDDYERKSKRTKRERETAKLTVPPGIYDTKHHTVDSTPSLGRRGDRPRTAHPPDRRPVDDYNFYRDPNIPGHAFPYYYLSYLLSMEGKNKKRSGENGGIARIVLKPAPVNKSPVWRTRSARPRRPAPKPQQSERSPSTSPKSRRRKKTKSVIKEKKEENLARSSSCESESPSLNHTSSAGSHSRIRPGSGPIKCSWKAQTEPEKPKFPRSDHQLKNTDNPEILDWLRRKDAQLRARRQNEIRKHRRKTEKLIDEQNDLEDKHERAFRQYDMWKKTKDRDILLRRRKEAKEANSAIFTRRENELKMAKRKERPRTASNGPQKADEGSTFSELRSSSARPKIDDKTKPRKQRPKSANTIEVSLSDQVQTPSLRPKSAMPPRKSDVDNTKRQSAFQRTENFFKSFLGVGGTQTKDKHSEGNQAPTKPVATVVSEERGAYDKWVRSGSPSNRDSSKTEGKNKPKASAPGRSKNKQRGHKLRLPPHDHSDNDLISNLAKRRIESILSSRKGVDTDLKKRPKSGMNGLRQPTPPAGSRN